MVRLAVDLYGTRIGWLSGDSWRTADFEADDSGINQFGFGSAIMSFSIPLLPSYPPKRASSRRAFFVELLPEGSNLEWLLRGTGIAESDPLAILSRFGRDVAGAVEIWNPTDPGEPRIPSYEPISDAAIAEMLANPPAARLGNDVLRGATSLAGVQSKIVLAHTSDGWAQAIDGYPTTHILKPRSTDDRFRHVIDAEAYGCKLAHHIGLIDYHTSIERFGDFDALVIERFDRDRSVIGGRIHQEDFNQVLGLTGNQKYQTYPGGATLKQVAKALDENGMKSSLTQLARQLTFAAALGVLDMHAKNLGILHLPDGSARLAPAYDLLPDFWLPGNDQLFAMKIDGAEHVAEITRANLENEVRSWRDPAAVHVVSETLDQLREAVAVVEPPAALPFDIAPVVQSRVNRLIDGNSAGRADR